MISTDRTYEHVQHKTYFSMSRTTHHSSYLKSEIHGGPDIRLSSTLGKMRVD